MSLAEKLSLIHDAREDPRSYQGQAGYVGGVPRLGIPGLRFADGPPGVLTRHPSQAETATMGLAATFDATLAHDNGVVIGREARALGIDVAAGPQGFRLQEGHHLELLDAAAIRAALRDEATGRLHRLEVLFEVDSTNTRLLERPGPPSGFADAALAEVQNAGRGRQGRRWISPFGASLALSLGWTFSDAERVDSTLSLAVGVAVCRALGGLGARGMRLKWPNDVWFEDRKLGGVLVETRMGGGTAQAVVGIGLNLHLSAESRRQIGALAGTPEIDAFTDRARQLAGQAREEVR